MGYMRHHAIVVTSWHQEKLQSAHHEATRLGCVVTPITPEATNGYASFLVAPDGSKEGWDTSNTGNEQRDALVEWLRFQSFSDGSSYYDRVEVQFGDDDNQAKLTRAGDLDMAATRPY